MGHGQDILGDLTEKLAGAGDNLHLTEEQTNQGFASLENAVLTKAPLILQQQGKL